MCIESLYAGIAAARTAADVGRLRQELSRDMCDGRVTTTAAETLYVALDTLEMGLRPNRAVATRSLEDVVAACEQRRSIFPKRRYQPIRDRTEARRRRQCLAASGPLPPHLAATFTVTGLAVLRIVADECAAHGECTACVEELAARAGTCRRATQYALREAERAGLIVTVLRPQRGQPNDTNLVTVRDREWLAWIEQGKRPGPKGRVQNFAPHGQGSNSEPSEPCGIVKEAAGRREAEPVRQDHTPQDLPEPAEPGDAGAMPRAHVSVRPDEQTPTIVETTREGSVSSFHRHPPLSTALHSSLCSDSTFRLGPHAQRLLEWLEADKRRDGLAGASGLLVHEAATDSLPDSFEGVRQGRATEAIEPGGRTPDRGAVELRTPSTSVDVRRTLEGTGVTFITVEAIDDLGARLKLGDTP